MRDKITPALRMMSLGLTVLIPMLISISCAHKVPEETPEEVDWVLQGTNDWFRYIQAEQFDLALMLISENFAPQRIENLELTATNEELNAHIAEVQNADSMEQTQWTFGQKSFQNKNELTQYFSLAQSKKLFAHCEIISGEEAFECTREDDWAYTGIYTLHTRGGEISWRLFWRLEEAGWRIVDLQWEMY